MAKSEHRWRFFRAGGFDQVRLDSGDDLVRLGELDQKLWVALACPSKGLEFDPKTLEILDADKDGRIRAPDVIAAAKWATSLLKDPEKLVAGKASLRLDAIDDKSDAGKRVLSSAKTILQNLGKADAKEISVEDTADTQKIFTQTRFNGDGIVPVDSAEDEPTKQAITDVIAAVGADTDRSGKPGVSQPKIDQFWKDAADYLAWWKKADDDKSVRPLGDATDEAMALVRKLKPKIDDYFARSRLAAFDPRAADVVNRSIEDLQALAKSELSLASPELAALPLARVAAGQALPLLAGTNPAFSDALLALKDKVVTPLLGERSALSDADWHTLSDQLAVYEAWQAAKVGVSVEPLGRARVKALVDGDAKARIEKLIAEDKALENEFNEISDVDRLVRYHRDLFRLLNNFVSFRDFYTRSDKAIFQAGTLYLDQRSCEMCMRVEDAGRHAAVANLSRSYLVYCDLTRKATNEKMSIVAAVTDGDPGDLAVGRNGIFYDREGRDWDATITKIVENPISIRQAFWAPYRKVASLVEEQIGKFAASRDKEVEASAAAKVDDAAKTSVAGADAAAAPPPKAAAPFDVAKFAGIFAAIGLAIGAIGGVLGTIFGAFLRLPLWEVPLALAGLMLLISGPSMLLSWLKLRQRNLGPLLDANGWAINTKARINIPFGRSLTNLAKLPPGSERDLRDPFAEQHKWRDRMILLAIVLAAAWAGWYYGPMQKYLPWLPESGYHLRRAKQAAEDEAQKKADEAKAAAEKKAADDKLKAEVEAAKKAAEEKIAAEKKAADEKLAAEKAAADKAAADKKP